MFQGNISSGASQTIINASNTLPEGGERLYTCQASGAGTCELYVRLSDAQPWHQLGTLSGGEVKTFPISGHVAMEARAVSGDVLLTVRR